MTHKETVSKQPTVAIKNNEKARRLKKWAALFVAIVIIGAGCGVIYINNVKEQKPPMEITKENQQILPTVPNKEKTEQEKIAEKAAVIIDGWINSEKEIFKKYEQLSKQYVKYSENASVEEKAFFAQQLRYMEGMCTSEYEGALYRDMPTLLPLVSKLARSKDKEQIKMLAELAYKFENNTTIWPPSARKIIVKYLSENEVSSDEIIGGLSFFILLDKVIKYIDGKHDFSLSALLSPIISDDLEKIAKKSPQYDILVEATKNFIIKLDGSPQSVNETSKPLKFIEDEERIYKKIIDFVEMAEVLLKE